LHPVRILLVSAHPVQYASPLYRLYALDPHLDVTVAYCSLQGALSGTDPGFGIEVAWDTSLLEGYPWVCVPNRSPWPRLGSFWGLLNPGLWRLIRQGRFDVVVCYGYGTASFWIAAVAARLAGAALVLTTDAHTLLPRDGASWKIGVKRRLLPTVFGFACALFAPSTKTRRFLQSLGVPVKSIYLTPYAVDNDFFSTKAETVDRGVVRQRWGVPDDAVVALYVGKLVPWKRPGDFLEALARVPELWGVFVGEGSLRAKLTARSGELGVSERVRFVGFLNQSGLPEAYTTADFLVLPSQHEPFGLVVNEAFSCQRPAVVTEACGAVGDLVQDGETGFVVPVADVGTLAMRLRQLATDADLRISLGRRARDRMSQWGPAQNVAAFAGACRDLLEKTKRRGVGEANAR
jgi:glycosyltransferase involved in cell wall biosynthesis